RPRTRPTSSRQRLTAAGRRGRAQRPPSAEFQGPSHCTKVVPAKRTRPVGRFPSRVVALLCVLAYTLVASPGGGGLPAPPPAASGQARPDRGLCHKPRRYCEASLPRRKGPTVVRAMPPPTATPLSGASLPALRFGPPSPNGVNGGPAPAPPSPNGSNG